MAGADPERGVLGIGVVAGRGAVAVLLHREMVHHARLLSNAGFRLIEVAHAARRARRLAGRSGGHLAPGDRDGVGIGGRRSVRPLAVDALVVDQELGALVYPALIPHPVEFLEDHRLERDVVGRLERPLHHLLEEFLEARAGFGAGMDKREQEELVGRLGGVMTRGFGRLEKLDSLVDGPIHSLLIDARVGGRFLRLLGILCCRDPGRDEHQDRDIPQPLHPQPPGSYYARTPQYYLEEGES